MPWALAAAAVTAGAGLLQANSASKANKAAQTAESAATDKQIAAQQQALQQVTALQQPYINAGYGALSQLGANYGYGAPPPATAAGVPNPFAPALMDRATGLQGPAPVAAKDPNVPQTIPSSPNPAYVGGVPVTTPGTPGTQAGAPDWDAYIAANPDVAAWIQAGHGDPSLGPNQTPEQAAAFQYQNTGQSEGRQLPTAAGSPGTPATVAQTPADTALSQAIGERPTWQTPDYGTAPTSANYFGDFRTDPGYQFSLAQRLRGGNAAFGARGLLKSDAAIKALSDYAGGMADQQYGSWWNRQNTLLNEDRNQFNDDRSANYNIFSNDRAFGNNNFVDSRNYATNRYDTTANNLFRTIGLGTGAAASVAGANTNYANAAGSIYGNQGDNTANLALANGATNSQLIGNIAGAAGNYLNLRSLSGQVSNPFGSLPTSGWDVLNVPGTF